MHKEGGLLPVLTYPLMMKRMAITGKDQELLQVRPSLMKTSAIINENNKGPYCRGLGNNVMSKAQDQISRSPFTRKIEGARLPRWFHQLTFTLYNGRTNPVEHVTQFNQRITVHSKNETLMCKVFPSSLGLVAMRWFNGLKTNSIDSYK